MLCGFQNSQEPSSSQAPPTPEHLGPSSPRLCGERPREQGRWTQALSTREAEQRCPRPAFLSSGCAARGTPDTNVLLLSWGPGDRVSPQKQRYKAQEARRRKAARPDTTCPHRVQTPRRPPRHTVLTPSGSELLRQRLSRRMLQLSSDFECFIFILLKGRDRERERENLPVHSPNAWAGPPPAASQDDWQWAGAEAEEPGKLTRGPGASGVGVGGHPL